MSVMPCMLRFLNYFMEQKIDTKSCTQISTEFSSGQIDWKRMMQSEKGKEFLLFID